MTTEKALSHYEKYFDMANDEERRLCHDTIGQLERATRASDVAAVVGKLYGVSGINISVVKSGLFIDTLVTLAANVKSGRSINNVRDHIKNVIFRDKWESREREERERREQASKRFSIRGNTITINCAISFDMAKFELFKSIIHQLDATLSEVEINCIDGSAGMGGMYGWIYENIPVVPRKYFQIAGSAAAIAGVLHFVHDEWGASSLEDISYESDAVGYRQYDLTLVQAMQLADNETE